MITRGILTATLLLAAVPAAAAQVKDATGNPLGVGLPAKGAIGDFNGGRISAGRIAKCLVYDEPAARCVFFPRNGDGSFAIDVDGMAYYADVSGIDTITVDYDNGARMVPQGTFVRSKLDKACWLQAKLRLCVW